MFDRAYEVAERLISRLDRVIQLLEQLLKEYEHGQR